MGYSLEFLKKLPQLRVVTVWFSGFHSVIWMFQTSEGLAGLPSQVNYFHNNTKMLSAFLTLVLSQIYGEILQKLNMWWHHHPHS